MYEILKRALDEALTAAYAGELPAGAEEVVFSEGFEREMRGLIRKTDRPIRKYVRILTAAACAAIAVGCAVLLPRLLSQPVPVVSSESLTTTESSAPKEDRPDENTSAAETTADEEISDLNPGAAGGVLPPDEDVTERDDDVGGSSGVPTTTPPVSEITTAPVSSEEEQTGGSSGISGSENTAEEEIAEVAPVEGTADEIPDDSDDADVGDDEAVVDDEDDMDVDDDDDMDVDDDDVGVDDSVDDVLDEADADAFETDWDNDEATDESGLPALAQKETLNEEIETLIGCSLADCYVQSGDFLIDGKFYSLPIVEGIDPETYRDPALAERIGAAEYIGDELPETELALLLFWGNVGKEPPVIQPIRDGDHSDRNHYGDLYFDEDSEVEDEEDDHWNPVSFPYLQFYRNGIVQVFMDGYVGTAVYRLDDETLSVLIERIETRYKLREPKTVGDLLGQLGTAEDYARISVTISRYYDCSMHGALSDGAFFEKLLEKYKDEKLRTESDEGAAAITVELVSRKLLRSERFVFFGNGTVRVGESSSRYFKIDEADVRAILTEYCRQKNLPAPVFYETLGEYLSDKNFTTLIDTTFRPFGGGKNLRISGDSAEIRALIEAYMGKSVLLSVGETFSDSEADQIVLRIEGWSFSMSVTRERITVGRYSGRVFETPAGLYDELLAILTEKGEDPYADRDDDYFDDDAELKDD